MKDFLEKLINSLPVFILVILGGTIFIFFYQNHMTYENFTGIIKILIWPTIVFFAILFFRKVFTYLFFSMEEYNFFGVKGKLKDIREVIEERVQIRFNEKETQTARTAEIEKISKEIEDAKISKDDAEKQAKKYFDIAEDIFGKFKKLSDEHVETTKELNVLRQERLEQDSRIAFLRERHHRMLKNRTLEDIHAPNVPRFAYSDETGRFERISSIKSNKPSQEKSKEDVLKTQLK